MSYNSVNTNNNTNNDEEEPANKDMLHVGDITINDDIDEEDVNDHVAGCTCNLCVIL